MNKLILAAALVLGIAAGAAARPTPAAKSNTKLGAAAQSGSVCSGSPNGHCAVLTWMATTTVCTAPCTSITYSVFRSATPGGEDYASPLASGLSTTTWTDLNVSLGSTYYYTVEAVENWTGNPLVSSPSNETTAVFPQQPSPASGLGNVPH